MKLNTLFGLAAVLVSVNVLAASDKLVKDIDDDGIKEEYTLKKEDGGKTLYVKDKTGERSLTIKGVMPPFYKLFNLPEKNCLRMGAENSDDFFDFCLKNGKFEATPSPMLD